MKSTNTLSKYLPLHFRHQPDVSVKKMKIKGEIVSSAPDIICYGFEGKVLCVVEVLQFLKEIGF